MMLKQQVCGIDVSKDVLDYCLVNRQSGGSSHSSVLNDVASIEQQFSLPQYDQTLFVVEHTGNYSAKALHVLSRLERQVVVVNPFHSKSYMSALGQVSKNDQQAAWTLAQMGLHLDIRPYKAPSMEQQKRTQLMRATLALEKQQRMLKNQLHALEQLPFVEASVQQALEQVLRNVTIQIEGLTKQLYNPSSDPEYEQKLRLATSVKGIGTKTANAILLATNGLEGFEDASKLAKFLGLTPHSHFSGSSVHKRGSMTRYGNSDVRAMLYICTRSAIRYNKACAALYLRLRAKGKPHKVAAVAVMHKLIKQVFFCVNNKTIFDNDFEEKQVTSSK
ncbi:MAG: IS110 family transposase [bacterium]|nr:IS110 family transposase [bacterium]